MAAGPLRFCGQEMGEQRTTRLLAWTVSSIVITMLVLSAVSWARVLD